MIDMRAFGDRISRLRRTSGLTQTALAHHMGLTPQAISKWERGMSFPDVSRLDELAALLGVQVADLLTEPQREVHKATEAPSEA